MQPQNALKAVIVKIVCKTLFSKELRDLYRQPIKRFKAAYRAISQNKAIFMGETLTKLLESVQKYAIKRCLQCSSLTFLKVSSNNRI